jgi:hypothetical protein
VALGSTITVSAGSPAGGGVSSAGGVVVVVVVGAAVVDVVEGAVVVEVVDELVVHDLRQLPPPLPAEAVPAAVPPMVIATMVITARPRRSAFMRSTGFSLLCACAAREARGLRTSPFGSRTTRSGLLALRPRLPTGLPLSRFA